jgi:hypothetical protein
LLDLRGGWFGRILCLRKIPPPETRAKIDQGMAAIVRCREKKGQVESIRDAHEAGLEATKLFEEAYEELGPKQAYDRLFTFWCSLLASLVSLLVGGIVGFCLARVTDWWRG